MLAGEKNRRQTELEKKIYELSEKLLNDAEIRNICLELLEIYKGDFRHSYSSFFPIIVEINKDENKYNKDYLTENLTHLCDYVEKDYVSGAKEFESISGSLNKLCDNLNTEIGRWSHYSQNDQIIKDIESQTKYLNSTMSDARKELAKASKQASSIQTELIAVLSIFAAIVVTFSGGFTFLGSVMTSVNEARYYEAVVLEAIVCGMVIFNTIFLLMYMVGKITERNIYARCTTIDCSCKKKCCGFNRIRKRLPYVFYFNIFCVIGIVVDCIVWYIDIRNQLGF
ncbi:MAG: hypothetical protein J1E83_12720 [Lachnospiraceae bacterium]|nr:hypothetical protein [Lachnospiraceae bacterium]